MVFTVTGWHQWHWEARDARKGFDNGDIEQLLLLTGDVQCPVSTQTPIPAQGSLQRRVAGCRQDWGREGQLRKAIESQTRQWRHSQGFPTNVHISWLGNLTRRGSRLVMISVLASYELINCESNNPMTILAHLCTDLQACCYYIPDSNLTDTDSNC